MANRWISTTTITIPPTITTGPILLPLPIIKSINNTTNNNNNKNFNNIVDVLGNTGTNSNNINTTKMSSSSEDNSVTPTELVVITNSEEFIVLPGPDDIFIFNSTDGLYHQSVTLTARMWPPVEAGPPTTIWGLPTVVWAILIGCILILFLILATLFFCCWLLPKKRKFLSPTRYCTTSPVAHRSSVLAKPWVDNTHHMIPMSIGLVPPQYSAPPAPHPPQLSSSITTTTTVGPGLRSGISSSIQHHPAQTNNNQIASLEYPSSPACGISISHGDSKYSIPETHKSMWAINPLYASNSVLSENDAAYKSRSLPSWGKSKQRPVSTTDDLEELYAKVNFSKKRRNRMRNDEAAIIALCRSRSQNLAGLPLEREGVVIYDERTAL